MSGGSAENYPEQPLEWTIAFGPGGGNDIMSRTLVDILKKEKLYPKDIAVENKEGGSGAVGWGYVFSKKGNPYHVSTTSGSFITTPLQADTGWTYKDFTLVGQLATDDSLFVVPKSSGITKWRQWEDQAKRKGKVTVGGIGTVNVDFILHAQLAKQAGYKIDYVPFNDEGQLLTAMTSGSLDAVVSNPSEVLGQVSGGRMNAVLFTGKEALPQLPDVPTANSLGFKNLVATPRGLLLPPDVPDNVRDWWIETMKKVGKTERWRAYLKDNNLIRDEAWGDDFEKELDATSKRFERILRAHGAIK
ncbi:MAG: tripartite tricarboxylate transporter substrate binding protein [Pseudonocardiaceae bacterium]|nr:tripartite tricarboxylate transporter substrate binding protein [Pseudonocardiaceae bacterium]